MLFPGSAFGHTRRLRTRRRQSSQDARLAFGDTFRSGVWYVALLFGGEQRLGRVARIAR